MKSRTPSIAAYVRAKRWKLNELTRSKQQVDEAGRRCREQARVLEGALDEELARQQALFGRGSFHVWELSDRGQVHVSILEQIQAVGKRIEALDAQARQIADEMESERREKALLEHALERRARDEIKEAATRVGRETDAMVAARGGAASALTGSTR